MVKTRAHSMIMVGIRRTLWNMRLTCRTGPIKKAVAPTANAHSLPPSVGPSIRTQGHDGGKRIADRKASRVATLRTQAYGGGVTRRSRHELELQAGRAHAACPYQRCKRENHGHNTQNPSDGRANEKAVEPLLERKPAVMLPVRSQWQHKRSSKVTHRGQHWASSSDSFSSPPKKELVMVLDITGPT
eukprot:scaffold249_cov405-Prasinococcus_capsulatus_cf.AAC.10